jgi:Fe-Mn family superoxide dismutase
MNTQTGFSRREFLAGLGVTVGALGLSALGTACNKSLDLAHGNDPKLYPIYDGKQYTLKDFTHLTKDTNLGLSPTILENHLGLYKGYVDKVNQAEMQMLAGDINETSMKNLAFSLNGMALHDIYFSNMSSNNGKCSSALNKAIDTSYGSFDKYFANLVAIANQVPGWSITALNLLNGKLVNYGIADHSANFPNFVMPILALDVYEHAYVMDFGAEGKAKYIEIFTRIIDWDLVSRRYDALKIIF